jgi:hypothetical protein
MMRMIAIVLKRIKPARPDEIMPLGRISIPTTRFQGRA